MSPAAKEVASDQPEVAEATETISALSVQQPYADDIFFGSKWCENRSWHTAHRGELFIHSSKVDEIAVADLLDDEKYDARKHSKTGLMTGAILGRVNLVACVTSEKLLSIADDDVCKMLGIKLEKRPEFDESDPESIFLRELLAETSTESWRHWCRAKYAWIFAQPEMLSEVIPTGGKLRIWTMEIESIRLVTASPQKRKWKLPSP